MAQPPLDRSPRTASTTTQTTTTKTAQHPLDQLYLDHLTLPDDQAIMNALLSEVLREAKRITRDDDAAQEVCLYVLGHLDGFVITDASDFRRWVRTICRHRRLIVMNGQVKDRSHDHLTGTDDLYDMEASEFQDFASLPAGIKEISLELSRGDSIDEIATRRGVKPNSIYKKVMRACPEIDSSSSL